MPSRADVPVLLSLALLHMVGFGPLVAPVVSVGVATGTTVRAGP